MEPILKARLKWVELYLDIGDAGYVCRRCGISRPTLRKWFKRYQKEGIKGLTDLSKKPLSSPKKKVDDQITEWILGLRNNRNLGARRIVDSMISLFHSQPFTRFLLLKRRIKILAVFL